MLYAQLTGLVPLSTVPTLEPTHLEEDFNGYQKRRRREDTYGVDDLSMLVTFAWNVASRYRTSELPTFPQ
jgi:hypothetical protein